MSLDSWQRALVGRLTGETGRYDMNRRECRWMAMVVDTAGFAVTRRVQREWRVFRIANALPLTRRLLAGSFAELTAGYLAVCAEPASFFLREAEQFVAWCPREPAPHFAAVSRFELAMVRNASAEQGPRSDPPSGRQTIFTSAGTEVVRFAASPALVLGALAAGDTPHGLQTRVSTLVTDAWTLSCNVEGAL